MKKFTPLFLLIISAGIFFTYIDPQYKIISAKQTEIDKYDMALDKKSAIEERSRDLADKYSKISKSDIEKMSKLVPDNVDNVRLIVDIDSLAIKHGIFIRGIQLSEEKSDTQAQSPASDIGKAPYQSVILSFTFKSSYSVFKTFLEDIESSLRLIDIASVAFVVAEPGQNKSAGLAPGENEYKVSIRTYWIDSKTK